MQILEKTLPYNQTQTIKNMSSNTAAKTQISGTQSPPLEATGSEVPMGVSSIDGTKPNHVSDREQRKGATHLYGGLMSKVSYYLLSRILWRLGKMISSIFLDRRHISDRFLQDEAQSKKEHAQGAKKMGQSMAAEFEERT